MDMIHMRMNMTQRRDAIRRRLPLRQIPTPTPINTIVLKSSCLRHLALLHHHYIRHLNNRPDIPHSKAHILRNQRTIPQLTRNSQVLRLPAVLHILLRKIPLQGPDIRPALLLHLVAMETPDFLAVVGTKM